LGLKACLKGKDYHKEKSDFPSLSRKKGYSQGKKRGGFARKKSAGTIHDLQTRGTQIGTAMVLNKENGNETEYGKAETGSRGVVYIQYPQ